MPGTSAAEVATFPYADRRLPGRGASRSLRCAAAVLRPADIGHAVMGLTGQRPPDRQRSNAMPPLPPGIASIVRAFSIAAPEAVLSKTHQLSVARRFENHLMSASV